MPEQPYDLLVLGGLALAALLGGALNAVAGGGSFFTFPALLLTGMDPIVANATSTVALWPGGLASAHAYREELSGERAALRRLWLPCVVGGAAGALLLVATPTRVFSRLVPFLLLLATLLFTWGKPLARPAGGPAAAGALDPRGWVRGIQLGVAVYGGYFGGGMGFMMLALFGAAGMTDVHRMNALKVLLGVAINGVAVLTLSAAGAVAWVPAAVMTVGAGLGAYGGAALARRVSAARVRGFVVAVGWVLTAAFFWRTFAP